MEQSKVHQGNMSSVKLLLENGVVLSVMSCFEALRTYELKHYVYLLKKAGMKILSKWKTGSDGKRFKVYWFEEEKSSTAA